MAVAGALLGKSEKLSMAICVRVRMLASAVTTAKSVACPGSSPICSKVLGQLPTADARTGGENRSCEQLKINVTIFLRNRYR